MFLKTCFYFQMWKYRPTFLYNFLYRIGSSIFNHLILRKISRSDNGATRCQISRHRPIDPAIGELTVPPTLYLDLKGSILRGGSEEKGEKRSVELAGLPTPLTFQPLPSIPFHLALPPPPTNYTCLLYTSPSPRDRQKSRMPSSA